MEYIIVQAGGKGTRLKRLTQNKPKALVPVQNLPMLFHLFRKYPDKRFVIIADYQKDVMRNYLQAFADVKYQIVETDKPGTCAGLRKALKLLPPSEPFMLIWSDLILPDAFQLPEDYTRCCKPKKDYIGISKTFPCRWKYENGTFQEKTSSEYGVAGFFLFSEQKKLSDVPDSGELVRWMQEKGMEFEEVSLAGTKEFGLLEEYEKLGQEKCRPFNRITVDGDVLTKEPVDAQGKKLAVREENWYRKAGNLNIPVLPQIYSFSPLRMEFIKGKNIYDIDLPYTEKRRILEVLVSSLKKLHVSGAVSADSFSVKEAYFNKTMDRLAVIEDLVPFAREKVIKINEKPCRNVFFHKRELEKQLEQLTCKTFVFIHGDCTFSNMMLRENGEPVLIDPRGYFGYSELYGDVRYDWAKLYYSIVGNYDRFNLKRFHLTIGDTPEAGVSLSVESNGWEDMEKDFFELTQANEQEIKLLHAVIWLSLTTYAWQDYDSICGAFYNGLWYLEDVL